MRRVSVFILVLSALYASGQAPITIPAVYFGNQEQHSGGSCCAPGSSMAAINIGALRIWDGVGFKWNEIAKCDPRVAGCNPETKWNFAQVDQVLNDAFQLGITNIQYTIGGEPQYSNLCVTGNPKNCPGNTNNQLPKGDCGNTYPDGCVAEPTLTADGTGTDETWIAFVTALANHVHGVGTASIYCSGNNQPYLNCHNPITVWDPANEWNRNQRVVPAETSGNTVYWTYAMMQRRSKDLADIVHPFGDIVVTPSTTGQNQPQLQAVLYCTGSPAHCNASLLGAGPTSTYDGLNLHTYYRVPSTVNQPEGLIGLYSAERGYLHTTERNAWSGTSYISEFSWGCDADDNEKPPGKGCVGNLTGHALINTDLQAAFASRALLVGWAAGWNTIYWYAFDNCDYPNRDGTWFGTGTLFGDNAGCRKNAPPPPQLAGIWLSGTAYNITQSIMVGKKMTVPCSKGGSGTVWQCTLKDPATGNLTLAVWDTSKGCTAGIDPTTVGTCATSSFAVTGSYDTYTTVNPGDTPHVIVAGHVPIGAKPIFLTASAPSGPAGGLTGHLALTGHMTLTLAGGNAPKFSIDHIDDTHGASGGQNCTGTKVGVSAPGWEWNCDPNIANCSLTVPGPICGNSSLVASPSLDGQSREMDVAWGCPGGGTCSTNQGGVNFHSDINSTGNGNLDTTDTRWQWGGAFYYTDLTHINQLEFDLYQVPNTTDVLIFAAQCDFTRSGGMWSFGNGWPAAGHSNIPCPKSSWTANTWHTLQIQAHRCTNYTLGQPCNITYDGVTFDGTTVNCTTKCVVDGNDAGLGFSPAGLLLQNVQLDMSFTGTGSMTSYADTMVTGVP